MPRTPAEKERIEKRIRLEKTIIPILCVFALALFIILSAVFGKRSISPSDQSDIEPTPAATQDPVLAAIEGLHGKLGGSISSAQDSSALSFVSPAGSKPSVITVYNKAERLCMRLTEEVGVEFASAAPEVQDTESLFVIDNTEKPDKTASQTPKVSSDYVVSMTEEICGYLSFINEDAYDTGFTSTFSSKLEQLFSGNTKKASLIFGLYLVELEYSSSDGILHMRCEPA